MIGRSHSGAFIAEYVLVVAQGMNVSALSNIIYIYSTLVKINRRVAGQQIKQVSALVFKRWIKPLFRLRGV